MLVLVEKQVRFTAVVLGKRKDGLTSIGSDNKEELLQELVKLNVKKYTLIEKAGN